MLYKGQYWHPDDNISPTAFKLEVDKVVREQEWERGENIPSVSDVFEDTE